jgi:excisionase family DNA binding protein
MTDDSPTITREHAARLLGTSERHVRRLIQQGRLRLEPDAHGALVLRQRAVLDLAAQSREVVTQLEAAKRLNCARRTIRRMLDDGRLQAVATPGGHDRVTIESVNARLINVSSKPDIIGQEADITGHIFDDAPTGAASDLIDLERPGIPDRDELPEASPDDADADVDDLVPLLTGEWPTMSAPPPPKADTKTRAVRRPGRPARFVAAAVLLAVAAVSGVVFFSTRTGANLASRATESPRNTSRTSHPREQRLHRPAATAASARPRTRGGPAILVTQPVRRTPLTRPTPARTGRATTTVPDMPIGPPTHARTPTLESACADLYGSEGLC